MFYKQVISQQQQRPRYSYCNIVTILIILITIILIIITRPKPAYGRQGLGWDRETGIQFGRVHFGVFSMHVSLCASDAQLGIESGA